MYGQQNLLVARREPPADEYRNWFDLEDWVGSGHPSHRADIARLEAILANSGDLSLERTQGPTGYWGLALDGALRRYQARNGLAVDGIVRPGGPTISHMRDTFGTLLAGHVPPTPADIDAHHEIVGDDNPGTIVWQAPPVSLDGIQGLPGIDHETDASNARLARTMVRTGDFRGYAKLLAQTIEQSGKSGLAAVKDLAGKFDELQPGKGGQLLAAVMPDVSDDAKREFGIELPEPKPKGTKVALGPMALAVPFATDATLGLLAAGTAAAGAYGAKKTLDGLRAIPGSGTPPNLVDPNDTTSPAPVPAGPTDTGNRLPTPKMPNNTGSPVEPPKAEDGIEGFSALLPEKKRQEISDLIGKHFAGKLEARAIGDRYDNRGGDLTTELNKDVAKICTEEAKNSRLPELLLHKGGASFEGNDEDYMEEVTIKDDETGKSRRSDFAQGPKNETDPRMFGHINTYTAKADGTPIAAEVRAYIDMLNMVEIPDLVGMIRKRRPDEDRETYRETVIRPVCRKIVEAQIRVHEGNAKKGSDSE